MALSPISDDWNQEIAEAAEEFMNGVIDVYTPGSPGTYDPIEDEVTGGTPDVYYLEGRKARVQQLTDSESAGSAQWKTEIRFRFQVPLEPTDLRIPKGALVRIVNPGRDHTLTQYAPQVISAVNSSHAPLRTIEAVAQIG